MHLIKIPNLGVNIERARIVEWCKKEGEHIKQGDILLKVDTEKALFDVEAETSGILYYIIFGVGKTVPLNSVVGVIASEGEKIPSRYKILQQNKLSAKKLPLFVSRKSGRIKSLDSLSKSQLDVRATPKARVLAKERGINIAVIDGSGPEGIITVRDIESYVSKKRMKVAIVNASKGGRIVYEALSKDSSFIIVGFIDDNPDFKGKQKEGLPVLGKTTDFRSLINDNVIEGVYVAIGNSIKARVRVASLAEKAGLKLINVIDKRSIVSPTVKIGKNVWIKQGAIIERNSEIGSNVIVDSGCVVSHDVIISPNCHLSPGCRFGGTVFVGKNSIIGVGASISPYVKIGKYVILSPGSSVVNDIPDYSIVEGVPGRIIGSSKEKDKER